METDGVLGKELGQWWQQARAAAPAQDIDPQELDWLLMQLYGLDRLTLRLGHWPQEILSGPSLGDLQQRWQRRCQERVPVQYLAGATPWRDLTLGVGPGVLVPRPETELLIDLILESLGSDPLGLGSGIWADLGTGSGAIALGLAQALPQAQILGVDISPGALAVARANGVATGLGERVTWLQGSWFDPLAGYQGQLAGMVSNPPYIPSALLPTLAPEVVNHEPAIALDGGPDGLVALRQLVAIAPAFLRPGGYWVVEVMAGQTAAVGDLLAATGAYEGIRPVGDLAGRDRFVLAQRQAGSG